MGSGSLRGGGVVLPLLLFSTAHGFADGHRLVLRDLAQGLGKLSYPLGLS